MTRIALSALLLAASLVAPPPVTAAASLAEPIPDGAVVDQFDGTTLGEDWTVLSPDSSRWSLSGGALRVESLTGDTYQGTNTARNLFLVDVPAGDFEVVTKLSAPVALDYQSAGLLAWQDWDNYVRAGLAHVGSAGGPVIETDTEVGASFNASFAARPGYDGQRCPAATPGDVRTGRSRTSSEARRGRTGRSGPGEAGPRYFRKHYGKLR
ncbi:beta-xylosidase family glycoside hydrolase [Nonomuraea sp. NPDC003707]